MKKAIPTLNVRLLNRVKRQILKEPKQFQMLHAFDSHGGCSSWSDAAEKIPNCGTAACIAGWAVVVSESSTPHKAQMKRRNPLYKAHRLLGVSRHQGTRLFNIRFWPDVFQRKHNEYTRTKRWKLRAINAAARIDHFVKTGE